MSFSFVLQFFILVNIQTEMFLNAVLKFQPWDLWFLRPTSQLEMFYIFMQIKKNQTQTKQTMKMLWFKYSSFFQKKNDQF